jgi:hypothetical protein
MTTRLYEIERLPELGATRILLSPDIKALPSQQAMEKLNARLGHLYDELDRREAIMKFPRPRPRTEFGNCIWKRRWSSTALPASETGTAPRKALLVHSGRTRCPLEATSKAFHPETASFAPIRRSAA